MVQISFHFKKALFKLKRKKILNQKFYFCLIDEMIGFLTKKTNHCFFYVDNINCINCI